MWSALQVMPLADHPPIIWLPFTLLWIHGNETHVALEPVMSKCLGSTFLTAARMVCPVSGTGYVPYWFWDLPMAWTTAGAGAYASNGPGRRCRSTSPHTRLLVPSSVRCFQRRLAGSHISGGGVVPQRGGAHLCPLKEAMQGFGEGEGA